MQQLNRVSALAAAFLITASAARAQDQPPIGLAPPDPARAVYVSGAGGQTRVPVRIIMARASLLAVSRKGTWSGDTLSTRTPVALTVAAGTPSVIFLAAPTGAIRVTLAAPPDTLPETAAGSEVMLQPSQGRRSLSVREQR